MDVKSDVANVKMLLVYKSKRFNKLEQYFSICWNFLFINMYNFFSFILCSFTLFGHLPMLSII